MIKQLTFSNWTKSQPPWSYYWCIPVPNSLLKTKQEKKSFASKICFYCHKAAKTEAMKRQPSQCSNLELGVCLCEHFHMVCVCLLHACVCSRLCVRERCCTLVSSSAAGSLWLYWQSPLSLLFATIGTITHIYTHTRPHRSIQHLHGGP